MVRSDPPRDKPPHDTVLACDGTGNRPSLVSVLSSPSSVLWLLTQHSLFYTSRDRGDVMQWIDLQEPEPGCPGSNPDTATYSLCDVRQVTSLLRASAAPSEKQTFGYPLRRAISKPRRIRVYKALGIISSP